jgi:L-ribulose-5-phosphate 3-epimerase
MQPLEIGVIFWAGGDPRETLRGLKELGVNAGQLGLPGDYPLQGAAAKWKQALADEQFEIATVVCAYTGENYADVPTVQGTVGFMPPGTRQERVERTLAASDFAREIGVGSIACHVGFVPHSADDPEYIAVREVVRRICDHAANNSQTFALETGQEPADVLGNFIKDVRRPNLAINFDPANMILYGTGDPIQALAAVFPWVVSVHCKDGVWPVKEGALGVETPLGKGAVGMDQFIAKLKSLGYKGILCIEREIDDPEQKKADVRMAIGLLQELRRA